MTFALIPILAVPFAHPGMAAAGAGLVSLPIVIHLLNRRRFRRIIWAAMDWLLAAHRKNARRIRIEQLLLLLIRCLIMLLIGFAIARPFLGALGLGKLFGQNRTLRVIVIDDSYSMNYASSGATTPLDRAKEAARKLLKMYGPDDTVSIVLSGYPARAVIDKPTYDHRAALSAIDEIRPSARATDLPKALEKVQAILQQDGAPIGQQVTLIGDRSRSAWQPGGEKHDALTPALNTLAERADLMFVDVGPREAHNLAITDVAARYELVGEEHIIQFSATVHNFGAEDARNMQLKVTIDADRPGGRTVDQPILLPVNKSIVVLPGKDETIHETLPFPGPGFHTLDVRLVDRGSDSLGDDLLAVDNQRRLSMDLLSSMRALLIDGDPGQMDTPGDAETFYLRVALAPITGLGGLDQLAEMESYTLRPQVEESLVRSPGWLARSNIVALANVNLLRVKDYPDVARDLSDFVRAGGGLMIFVGDRTENAKAIDLYNELFYQDGKGVMPAKLVGAVGDPENRSAGDHIEIAAPNHPVLNEFITSKKEALQSARFFRHMKVEVPAKSEAEVLLQYTGGDPAIVVKRFGLGHCALITTTADTAWSTLPLKRDFLPLFHKLAYYLSPADDMTRNLAIGGELSESLTVEEAQSGPKLTIPTPDGPRTELLNARPMEGASPLSQRQFEVAYGPLVTPGFYRLEVSRLTNGEPVRQEFRYAVNPLASAEGDVRTMSDDAMGAVLNKKVRQVKTADLEDSGAAALTGAREISKILLYCVLGLCLLETLLAQRFGHFRE
ncbi:MAG: hypothetical protein BIFFINMI_03779 [Phycisphaerae bacterium]|nr:hypothetical protein [Phycisphaerae bacterium]